MSKPKPSPEQYEALQVFGAVEVDGTGDTGRLDKGGPDSVPPRRGGAQPAELVLTIEGICGAAILTHKPVGVATRKWLRREVMPQVASTGSYVGRTGGTNIPDLTFREMVISVAGNLPVGFTRRQLAQEARLLCRVPPEITNALVDTLLAEGVIYGLPRRADDHERLGLRQVHPRPPHTPPLPGTEAA